MWKCGEGMMQVCGTVVEVVECGKGNRCGRSVVVM